MNCLKRSVIYLLIAVTLLFFVVLLCACNDSDFYAKYGTSRGDSLASDALTVQVTDAASDTDGAQSDDISAGQESAPDGDDAVSDGSGEPLSGDGQSTDGTQLSDGTQSSDGDQADGTQVIDDGEGEDDQTVVGGDDEGPSDDDPAILPPSDEGADSDGDEEDLSDYEEIFDLSQSRSGLYRYLCYEEFGSDLTVYVGTEQIGRASITASGTILFDCGFTVAERELWGKWDDADHLYTYVLFEELTDEFRQITLRFSALQMDMTLAEAESLRPATPEQTGEDATGDPTDADQNPVDPNGQEGGDTPEGEVDPIPDPEEPTAGTGEALPTESGVGYLWEGKGAAQGVEIVLLTAEEEEYTFRLVGTETAYAALIAELTPYLTFMDDSRTTELYQATVVTEGMVYNLYLQIVRNEEGFLADVKVLGGAL